MRAPQAGVAITVVGSGVGWEPLAGAPDVTIILHEGTGSTPSTPHEVLLTIPADAAHMVIAS